MMKAHCDRCEELLDDHYQGWVEISSKIFHFHIETNHRNKEGEFCLKCLILILEAYLSELKSDKTVDANIIK